MANAPERADAVTTAGPRPDQITTAVPPAPPPTDAAEPYRPMSGLALAGFALAALFALVVLAGGLAAVYGRSPRLLTALLVAAPLAGVLAALAARRSGGAQLTLWAGGALAGLITIVGLGGLIAYTTSNPWDLPWLAWALPVIALLVCWMALSSIARSEGTLEGAALARWGTRLALFFSLIYGAYTLANSFAVRNQAKQVTDDFLTQLAQGTDDAVLQAYLLGKPEGARPPAAAARDFVGAENRARSIDQPGPFSRFKEADFVRLITLAGKANQFERVSVAPPTFDTGSYYVEQVYRVTNTFGSFEIAVTARSIDRVGPDAIKRRTWYVDLPRCRFEQELSLTAEGRRVMELTRYSQATAKRWADRTTQGLPGLAFLETVPAADREWMTAAWLAETSANQFGRELGFSPWAMVSSPELREGLENYRSAALLKTTDFWTVPDLRDKAPVAARALFQYPPPPQPFTNHVPAARMPSVYRVEGDKVVIGVTVRFLLTTQVNREAFILEGELLMEAAKTGDKVDLAGLRVRQFHLTRAQSAFDGPPDRPTPR